MLPIIRPIPIKGQIISNHNALSSNKKYVACLAKSSFFKKKLIIANLTKTFCADIKPKHFKHEFSNKTKISAISFNTESNKLYCLSQKKNHSTLHQFNLVEITNQSIKNEWQQQPSTSLSINGQCFLMDEINKNLTIFGFTGNTIFNKTMNTETCSITSKDMAPATTDITKISVNKINMLIYALLQNKSLIVLGQEDNSWVIKFTINDCPDIPSCYSNDGNTLVFKDTSNLQIRSLLSDDDGKILIKHSNPIKPGYNSTIKNICINPEGTRVMFFSLYINSNYKYGTRFYCNELQKYDSTWLEVGYNPVSVYTKDLQANCSFNDTASYYINSNKAILLVEYNWINFRGYGYSHPTELEIADKAKREYFIAENKRRREREREYRERERTRAQNANNSSSSRSSNNVYGFSNVIGNSQRGYLADNCSGGGCGDSSGGGCGGGGE